MKIPVSWLKEYVDFEADAKTLAERLTFAGIEVEGIALNGDVARDIIVGEITSVEPHINSTRLFLCLVNDGKKVIRVISAAANCRAGDRVPLAGPGATLPNGITIKETRIHGEMSQGVLCAEDELGLSEDHSGLMILPPDAPLGKPLADVLGPPDHVLSLEITPNRPDLLGIIGIAREVAALFGTKLKWPAFELREEGAEVQSAAAVAVEDSAACPRYTARVLTGAAVGPSPFWIRRRLSLAGIKTINNIVDATNYVLLETGQPLHAFDLAQLADKKIIVRRARAGEQIVALDKVTYKLNPQMLVIADSTKPVAIAGVMGGEATGISADTATILLESACFQPALIRKTSKTLGLASESSYRFERGVDIALVEYAGRRACDLMAGIAGAKAAKGVIDIFAVPPPERRITCRYGRASSLLGMEIPPKRITAIFNSLALPAVAENDAQCTVKAPTFRPDLETEADLIEEIARIHGLDKIPATDPHCRLVAEADDRAIRALFHCRQLLAALGLREIINYSFVSEKLLNLFDAAGAKHRVVIPRPVSAEHTTLRDSLLPQMVETLGRNRSRQVEEAAFFEIARVFRRQGESKYHEETRAAVGLMGAVGRTLMHKRHGIDEAEVFAWLKGILKQFYLKLSRSDDVTGAHNAAAASGLAVTEFTGHEKIPSGFYPVCFKPNRLAVITLAGAFCGVLGILKDEIRREWRILDPVGLIEFLPEVLLKHAFRTPAAKALPVYPSVTRDIALRAPAAMRHSRVTGIIWKNAPKELTSVVLFDIYESKEIGLGFKSMAYRLTYQSLERTLTDEEVNQLHEAVKTKLKNELMVEIREG